MFVEKLKKYFELVSVDNEKVYTFKKTFDDGCYAEIVLIGPLERRGIRFWYFAELNVYDEQGERNPDCFRKGYAREAMSQLLKVADDVGERLELSAYPKDDIISLEDLMNFYKDNMFKVMSGQEMYRDPLEEKKKRKKAGSESSKESSLRDWFKRRGAKGKKRGWVDCNAPDGKGGYKSCGRSKGEKRKRYPACRPTPGACKERGRGKSWGKKGSKRKRSRKKRNENMQLTTEQIKKIIQEELETVLHESSAIYIDKLEKLWENKEWDQVYELVTSLKDPNIYKWYTDKLDQEIASALADIRDLKKQRHRARAKRQQEDKYYSGRTPWHIIQPLEAEIDELENIKIPKAQKRIDSAKRRRTIVKLEILWDTKQYNQVEQLVRSLANPEVREWYIGKRKQEIIDRYKALESDEYYEKDPAPIEQFDMEIEDLRALDKELKALEGNTLMEKKGSKRRRKKKAKRDACYRKVRSRYKKWPSAYASGALVQCRNVGAKNWGNKSKKNESLNEEYINEEEMSDEDRKSLEKIRDKLYGASKAHKGQADDIDKILKEEELEEAVYNGKTVKLNKPMRGDVKKFKVYVNSGKKDAKGRIKAKKVNFGHGGTSAKRKGEKTMKIRKNNPKARKNFRARHNCDNPGPETKARYWSCRKW